MSENEKSTVTIRGIDKKIYNKLSGLAKELNKTVGELMNEAMSLVITLRGKIESIDSTILLIEGISRLTLSGEELKELDKKILIQNVDELIFEKDVETTHVKEKIYRLMNIGKIHVKGKINKLILYSKCINVKEIVFEGEINTD